MWNIVPIQSCMIIGVHDALVANYYSEDMSNFEVTLYPVPTAVRHSDTHIVGTINIEAPCRYGASSFRRFWVSSWFAGGNRFVTTIIDSHMIIGMCERCYWYKQWCERGETINE